MTAISSKTLSRIYMSNPHFIDTNRTPTKEIKYIAKKYHNGDVKLKILNNRLFVNIKM